MAVSIGFVGAGQFAGELVSLFHLHPGIGDVYVTDVLPDRAVDMVERIIRYESIDCNFQRVGKLKVAVKPGLPGISARHGSCRSWVRTTSCRTICTEVGS